MKVEDITNRYNEMLKIARYKGANEEQAQDAVQHLFMKLCEMEKKRGV